MFIHQSSPFKLRDNRLALIPRVSLAQNCQFLLAETVRPAIDRMKEPGQFTDQLRIDLTLIIEGTDTGLEFIQFVFFAVLDIHAALAVKPADLKCPVASLVTLTIAVISVGQKIFVTNGDPGNAGTIALFDQV